MGDVPEPDQHSTPLSVESAVPIERKVALARYLIEAGGSLVGFALPTFALVRLEHLPPDLSRISYFALPVASLALVMAIFIRGPDIGRLSSRKAARLTLVLAAAGLLSTAAYAYISDRLVVTLTEHSLGSDDRSESHVKPLFPSREIRTIVDEYEGEHDPYDAALREGEPNAAKLKALMFRQRGGSVVLLLGTMLLAQLLYVAAIVGGAWWVAERNVRPTVDLGGN
jgi:hypothetical protein